MSFRQRYTRHKSRFHMQKAQSRSQRPSWLCGSLLTCLQCALCLGLGFWSSGSLLKEGVRPTLGPTRCSCVGGKAQISHRGAAASKSASLWRRRGCRPRHAGQFLLYNSGPFVEEYFGPNSLHRKSPQHPQLPVRLPQKVGSAVRVAEEVRVDVAPLASAQVQGSLSFRCRVWG